MVRVPVAAPLMVALLLATAGCLSPDTREPPPEAGNPDAAEVTFDGTSTTATRSETATCDDDAGITAGGNVDAGLLLVHVLDGNGTTVYQDNFTGDVDLEVDGIEGAPGVWTLETHQVARGNATEFSGTYRVVLRC